MTDAQKDALRESLMGKSVRELIEMLIDKSDFIPEDAIYSAVIRDGSYSEEVINKTVNANFIVDIEELRYSFEVTMSWLENQPKKEDLYIKIQCPYYTDVIYPDTRCVAETPDSQIRRYLPHNNILPDGRRVHVTQSTFGGNYTLLVQIDACKNQDIIDEALEYTETWIKKLYLDPDEFKIEPYDTCIMQTP